MLPSNIIDKVITIARLCHISLIYFAAKIWHEHVLFCCISGRSEYHKERNRMVHRLNSDESKFYIIEILQPMHFYILN